MKDMKTKKPLAVRIFIRICVVAMVVSLVGVYVVYMIAPQQPVEEIDEINAENTEVTDVIIPELNPDNPEESWAPILVTEEWEINEMDQTVEVELENWQTELVRLWDLTDAVQIN